VRTSGSFDPALQQRAAAFLARPIPDELRPNYVCGSLAERMIAACARNEAIDPELLELAELAIGEYDDIVVSAKTGELRSYFAGSRDLLAEIVAAVR
jgi:hypothetical protein